MNVDTKADLAAAEDAAWEEFRQLVESVSPSDAGRPGYSPEGWSVKDLVAHVGSWLAEAGQMLEQIRYGTYQPGPVDVDRMNRTFYEANRDLSLSDVKAECWSARMRMLKEWDSLPEISPEAEEWFKESGPLHYQEHTPRLRAWVQELSSVTR